MFTGKGLEILYANSLGLKHALDFCHKNGSRLVFASTSEIYGCEERMPLREEYWGRVNVVGERSCYEEAKRFGESLIYNFNRIYNGNHGVVRIFNTYGPRMNLNDGRVVINFLKQALSSEPLTIYGDGQQTRSLCYVDDLCDALLLYGESQLTQPMNIGNDQEISVMELAQAVAKLVSTPDRKIEILSGGRLPEGEPRFRRPDLTLARKLLAPWTPRVTLEEGLRRTQEWVIRELHA